MSRKRFEQGFEVVLNEAKSTAQCKKPRVVRGSGHAHAAMSKLVLVIVAEPSGYEHSVSVQFIVCYEKGDQFPLIPFFIFGAAGRN